MIMNLKEQIADDFLESWTTKIRDWDAKKEIPVLKAFVSNDPNIQALTDRIRKMGLNVAFEDLSVFHTKMTVTRRSYFLQQYQTTEMVMSMEMLNDYPFMEHLINEGKRKLEKCGHAAKLHYFTFYGNDFRSNLIRLCWFSDGAPYRLRLSAPEDEIEQAIAEMKKQNSHLKFPHPEQRGYCNDDFERNHITAIFQFEEI